MADRIWMRSRHISISMERARAVEAHQVERERAMHDTTSALKAKFADWEAEMLETQTLLHASCDSLLVDEPSPDTPTEQGGWASGAGAWQGWMIRDSPYQAAESILAPDEGDALELASHMSDSVNGAREPPVHSAGKGAWAGKNKVARSGDRPVTVACSPRPIPSACCGGLLFEGHDWTSQLSPTSAHTNPQEQSSEI